MTVEAAIGTIVGDLRRFETLADRVEGLIGMQISRLRGGSGEWMILPMGSSFYLFSKDSEGQRRGREIVDAFLGPAIASVEAVPEGREILSPEWVAEGFVKLSRLHRISSGREGALEMLSRLEDLASTLAGRPTVRPEISMTTITDQLRDLRLAFHQRDDAQSRRLLEDVRLSGQVSAENLRSLTIEYLAAFGRWDEMRAMPHIPTLIRARRPRAISEHLIQMIWWSILSDPGHSSVREAFLSEGVLAEYGQLIRSIRVPSTAEGRLVCLLAALAEGDEAWRSDLFDGARDDRERTRMLELVPAYEAAPEVEAQLEDGTIASRESVATLFDSGRWDLALEAFLEQPTTNFADLAVEAVLDSQALEHAKDVLEIVRRWIADGDLAPRRRLANDLDELTRLVDGVCGGWLDWAERVSAEVRWADAAAVLRNHSADWAAISEMSAAEVSRLGEALIASTSGVNEDQIRSSLDLFCASAEDLLSVGATNDYCRAVVLILGDQESFSAPVREAYSGLLEAWLQAGPTAAEYREALALTAEIWARIESVFAVDWAIDILDAVTDASCPDLEARVALVTSLVESCRQFDVRLDARQRAELESIARAHGLPVREVQLQSADSPWTSVDDAVVGLYSLLPRAASTFDTRLRLLCTPREVVGNADKVATPALRALANRADFLIVDTWHAAHAATGGIDEVRPRDRQILPRQKGVSGFLRALAEAISA